MARKIKKKGVLSKFADYLSVASLLLCVGLAAAYFGKVGTHEYQGDFFAVDGDSLELDGIKFRLEGIDAPEARQFCRRSEGQWACGKQATGYLRKLVNSGNVICRSFGLDKYDRILARCFVGKTDINREMVANGWAVSFGGYFADEARAKDSKLGLWVGEFDRPRDWRENHSDVLESGEGLIESFIARIRLVWQWLLN